MEQPRSGILIGGAALTTIALFVEAEGGNEGFLGDGVVDDLSRWAEPAFGLGAIAACPAMWALGGLTSEEGVEETGRQLTGGMLLTYGIVGALKLGVVRERPDGSDMMSFPSAHSAAAACMAAVLWKRYGPEAGIPAAALASFVAASRIQIGRHFPSDVIAGLAIGAACGMAVADGGDDDESGERRHVVVGLGMDGNGIGVILR